VCPGSDAGNASGTDAAAHVEPATGWKETSIMASSSGPYLYEGLFLMSPSAGGDLAGSLTFVREMLERAGAEILTVQKWDDRKLAYPVRGQKRGTFILALFRVNGVQIANIERDCNLSEQVSRALMTRGDHLGETEIASIVQAGDKTAAEVKLRAEKQEAEKQESENQDEAEQPAEATA
jgi:small subunit ribosomal protein S6